MPRIDALTGLRWWAAFFVFCYHALVFAPLPGAVTAFLGKGFFGVTFFFVLSGFVLTWSASDRVSQSTFYWRRFARIYPSHFVALLLAIPVFYNLGFGHDEVWVKPVSVGILALSFVLGAVLVWMGRRLYRCGFNAGAAAMKSAVEQHLLVEHQRVNLRLAALMRIRVIHVLTHDSIGLGEDGPTHQPVEQLASLRAMPGMHVLRPADAMETAECWELALRHADGPSLLVLSRQGLPALRSDTGENRCSRGGYVLAEADGPRAATLIATGSEVCIAMQAREMLAGEGIKVAVVSLPCWELFEQQDESWRDQVLGGAPRIGIEAGVAFGWERWLGPDGVFIGMSSFGASAPAEELYRHFGITAEAAVAAVKKRVAA